MKSPVDQYTSELADRFHYVATWSPGTPIRLGDIGTLTGHEFVPKSTLRSVEIGFQILKDTTPENWDYESEGSITWHVKAAGELSADVPSVPKAKVGIGIRFGRQGSVALNAGGCRADRIADVIGLEDAMWDAWNHHLWDEDWVVVTEVIQADSATILIASARDAMVELQAKGSAKATPLGAAALSGGFGLVAKQGMHTTFVAEEGLTPFFRAIKIKESFLRGTRIETVRGNDVDPDAQTLGAPRTRGLRRPHGALTDLITGPMNP